MLPISLSQLPPGLTCLWSHCEIPVLNDDDGGDEGDDESDDEGEEEVVEVVELDTDDKMKLSSPGLPSADRLDVADT